MQDACIAFNNTVYKSSQGIQGYYDTLLGHAQNMPEYPDAHRLVTTFLKGLPESMRKKPLEEGLDPTTNSIDDFVAFAKLQEASHKAIDYFEKTMIQERSTTKPKVATPTKDATPAPKKSGTAWVKRSALDAKPTGQPRHLFATRKNPNANQPRQQGQVDHAKDSKQNASNPHKNETPLANKPSASVLCWNCGEAGHFSDKCPHKKKPAKEYVRAAYTEAPDEMPDEGDEQCDQSNASPDAESSKDEDEYVEVEILEDLSEWYERDDDVEFVYSMRDFGPVEDDFPAQPRFPIVEEDDEGDQIMTHQAPNGEELKVRIRKVKVRASQKPIVRPEVPANRKRCLATYTEIGNSKAWTLWDAGSTTTGITPAFAHVANITLSPLEEPRILQLGTVGSRSVIKYGAEVNLGLPGVTGKTYVDVANFDCYDMVVGTPFMWENKVILDFDKGRVIVNGVELGAKEVILEETDGRLRRHRATKKKQQ